MGITFTFAASDGDIDIIGMPCPTCEALWADYFAQQDDEAWADQAWSFLSAHQESCEAKMHDLNMSNSNAARVLQAVGLWDGVIDFPYCGTVGAQELCILIENNCTWPKTLEPSCARRVLSLYALAKQAADRQVKVGWS